MCAEAINPQQKMVEEMAQQALQNQEQALNPDPANPGDADAFDKAVSTISGGPMESHGAMRDPSLVGVRSATTPDPVTLGDSILDSIQQSGAAYREKVMAFRNDITNMAEGGSGGDMASLPKLLKLHFDLTEFGLHQQVASKTAGKVSSGVQTIFKNQ